MKKLVLTLLIIFSVTGFLFSQPVKKVERIKEEEVPVAVRSAFENDFGKMPEDGIWTVNFIVTNEGGKTTAKPISYTFRKGNKGDKIEIRYSPEGKLEASKGLNKIGGAS